MAGKPLTLSIIIPVYNEQDQLRACLDSIAKQSVKPDKVIVVDNNSTDESVSIAKEYDFVSVLHEKKQGIFYARNTGFNHANTDIIGRIDADSVLPKNWVDYVKTFLQHNRNEALTGGGYFYNVVFPRFNGWVQSQFVYRMNRLIMGHYITWGSNMAITSVMWRDVQSKLCERNDIHEDLDIAIHLHRIGYGISYREKLRVGVKIRRVLVQDKGLWTYLMLWPTTLRTHHIKGWIFGWFGAVFLFCCRPIVIAGNYLFKKRSKS